MTMKTSPAWLADAIFYQIYPPSFADSNGDGIGDLPGIIGNLDYLQSLGINGLWLSPCFLSPFKDGGYDISDFRQVDPRYGTNADLKELFDRAHQRGIKVVLDLVAGHTSTEHPWFKASCKAEKNAYSNYYIWNEDWVDDGDSMAMINGYAERNGNFAINFFACQPALNYGFAKPNPEHPWQLPIDHPDVLRIGRELRDIMRFYLDMGCDGFRVDMAPSLIKKDPGRVENIKFWQCMRRWFDKEFPDRVLISEWSYAPQALEAGFHIDFMIFFGTPAYTTLFRNEPERDIFFHISKKIFYEQDGNDYSVTNPYSFFDSRGLGDFSTFSKIYVDHYQKTKHLGYISIPSGNHDTPRLSDRRSPEDLKVIFAFLLTMPGMPFIYYGDEIGMRNIPGLVSKEGGYTRTQCRTPMQWDSSQNCGFSSAPAEKLYLPVDETDGRPTVSAQEKDKQSLLHTVREFCNLRHAHTALQGNGEIEFVYLEPNHPMIAYVRRAADEQILVILNPKGEAQRSVIPLSFSASRIQLLAGQCECLSTGKNELSCVMPGQSYAIINMEN